jgi:hypothetical protein
LQRNKILPLDSPLVYAGFVMQGEVLFSKMFVDSHPAAGEAAGKIVALFS